MKDEFLKLLSTQGMSLDQSKDTPQSLEPLESIIHDKSTAADRGSPDKRSQCCSAAMSMSVNSSPPKNDISDAVPTSPALPVESLGQSSPSSEKGQNNDDNVEIIEVDIRPTSKTHSPRVVMDGFITPTPNDVLIDEVESSSQHEQEMKNESEMLMVMMNAIIGDRETACKEIPVEEVLQSEDSELASLKKDSSSSESEAEVKPKSPLKVRPASGQSFYTDYDPANPTYLKPPSPRIDVPKQPDLGRVSRHGQDEYPSPNSTSSIRVQLYEKHQKQIADLKAYYEEELDDLREKVRQMEAKTLFSYQNQNSANSQWTNTSPSPQKNSATDAERDCTSLRLKVEWLEQAHRNATQRLKDSEHQVDELASKLSSYTIRMADAAAEIEELRSENRQREEESSKNSSKLKRMAIELEEASRMLHVKDQSLAESDAMLNRLMREYSAMSKDFEVLKHKHDGCENVVQDLKLEIATAKRQVNKMNFEFRRLEHENDLLTKRLQLTTSFNVAERFSTPPAPQNTKQRQEAPLSAREISFRHSQPAGLSSIQAHNAESKFSRPPSGHKSMPPYATSNLSEDTSDSTTDAEPLTPTKSVFFRNPSPQKNFEPSSLLRAEREVFGSPKKSPKRSVEKQPPSMESQFDRLLVEKQKVEASLNRLPSAPTNQTIRANKELLERQLDDIERKLAHFRLALKKSHVIRSSFT